MRFRRGKERRRITPSINIRKNALFLFLYSSLQQGFVFSLACVFVFSTCSAYLLCVRTKKEKKGRKKHFAFYADYMIYLLTQLVGYLLLKSYGKQQKRGKREKSNQASCEGRVSVYSYLQGEAVTAQLYTIAPMSLEEHPVVMQDDKWVI